MKKTRILYGVWLVALVILLAACSLEYLRMPALGSVRTTCFMLFGMADLLGVLMLLTGYVPFVRESAARTVQPSESDSQWTAPKRSTGFALRQLLAFGGATALYAVYCFYLDDLPHTGSTTDALVAGGLICAAAVLSGGMCFQTSFCE
ncbi:MAG: hypothetical protein LUD18_09795 [Lachnospiraceae bacterium]|nr:hypothetical protein [Lachnospiraceae bacterium]